MTARHLADFRQVWFVDFEFHAPPGEIPIVICMAAKEWRSGQTILLWQDELARSARPPLSLKTDCLYVAFFASAEFSCHLALGWPLPEATLDLYVENRNLTNGRHLVRGNGLLGALFHHGINAIEFEEKDAMRDLAVRGGPFSPNEKDALMSYCHSDVIATERLFDHLVPRLDLPRALLRGRYMKAVALMEACGIPIDRTTHNQLVNNADAIRKALIRQIDDRYGVYEDGRFREALFETYLANTNVPWPRLPSGRLDLKDDTFSFMTLRFPKLRRLKTLRSHLSQLQLKALPIGADDRNRCLLSPFSSKTGRNQPSSSGFVFGRAKWIRRLIKPQPSRALIYLDFDQQEFGIAAALSGDSAMQEAYGTSDPYLTFAVQATAAPATATKRTHKQIRDIYKACALAVQYGMGIDSLALRIGRTPVEASALINVHRRLYTNYWQWSESAISYASLMGKIHTVFGWQLLVNHTTNPRTIQNFPMQANGAEILRLGCSLLCEAGIDVCAPVHDAVLIECAAVDAPDVLSEAKSLLGRASKIVLDGFELRTGAQIVEYPCRLGSDDSDDIWRIIRTTLSH